MFAPRSLQVAHLRPTCRNALRTTFALLCAAAVTLLASTSASAQSEDAVVVAGAGGIRDVQVYDLRTDADGALEATRLGQRRIVPDTLGPSSITDIRVLPDGSSLLADVRARGFALVSPSGAQADYLLDPSGARRGVDSATVVTYTATGAALRVLYADSRRNVVAIHDVDAGRDIYLERFFLSQSRPDFAASIVLPEGRIAVATNWPGLDLSTIDILDIDPESPQSGVVLQIANRDFDEAEDSLVVVEELDDLRDLMARPDGSLLVTTRFAVLELDPRGALRWSLDTASSEDFSGELAAARLLPSGRIAVATFAPGVWTRPDNDHRVHWIDPAGPTLLARSAPLSRAPVALDPADGNGATGTLGFEAGLDAIGQGELADLELSSPLMLDATTYRRGESMSLRTVVRNAGSFAVPISGLSVRATEDGCDVAESPTARLLVETSSAIIGPGDTFEVREEVRLDRRFADRQWCARVRVRDLTGEVADFGEPGSAPFEVTPPAEVELPPVEVVDLGTFEDAPPPVDMGGADGGPSGDIGESSCGCRSLGREPRAPRRGALLWLVAIGAGILTRRLRAGRARASGVDTD